MSKYCTKCGTQLSNDDEFCFKCGKPISITNNTTQTTPSKTKPKYTPSKKQIIIAIILAIIVILSTIGIALLCTTTTEQKYKITFDARNDGELYTISTNGENVSFPTPTKSDCFFDGWYTKSGVHAIQAIKNNSRKTDLTLYAKWYTYETQTLQYNTYADVPSSSGFYSWYIRLEDITYWSYNHTYSFTARVAMTGLPFTRLTNGTSIRSWYLTYSSFYLNGYGTISFKGTGSEYVSQVSASTINPYQSTSIKNVFIKINTLVELN